MQELIERLEKATGPSRELDLAIDHATGERGTGYEPPNYTASIDTALMLVPEPTVEGDKGRVVEARFDFGRGRHFANVNYDFVGWGCSPAIALCIAALNARRSR